VCYRPARPVEQMSTSWKERLQKLLAIVGTAPPTSFDSDVGAFGQALDAWTERQRLKGKSSKEAEVEKRAFDL